jgi:hypothetical protein
MKYLSLQSVIHLEIRCSLITSPNMRGKINKAIKKAMEIDQII